LAPFIAGAQEGALGVLDTIRLILEEVIPILMLLAIAFFLWGVVKFIAAGGDDEKKAAAKGYIINGLIGLFVMVAFWAIITVFTETFGLFNDQAPIAPNVSPPVQF